MDENADNHQVSLTSAEFGRLFSQYKPYFVVVARSYVREETVAEDLVTDSFIAFWEKREMLTIPPDKVPSYILVSVKNRCINWLRAQNKHREIHQDILSTAMRIFQSRIRTLEAFEPSSVLLEELSVIVRRELDNMPEMMRSVFIARRYHDKSYKEIAVEFGLSVNQVEFTLYKATRIFRSALKDYLPAAMALLTLSILYPD